MASVALQDGKVILKNGKVSCSCCLVPTICCNYPAQALIDGIYTVADLPNELFAFSPSDGFFVTLEKTGGIFPAYIYPADSSVTIFIAEYEGVLQWHGPGGLPYGDCLISDPFVLDKFANSYTIQDFPWAGPFVVERISSCRWQITISGTLYFGNPDYPPATGTWTAIIELNGYYFKVDIIWINNDPSDFYYPNQAWSYLKLGAPTEPNSSPSGTYSGGEFGAISVS